jgi:hypothetical protein
MIWQLLRRYTMQFVRVKLNEKHPRNYSWNFPSDTNLANISIIGDSGAALLLLGECVTSVKNVKLKTLGMFLFKTVQVCKRMS